MNLNKQSAKPQVTLSQEDIARHKKLIGASLNTPLTFEQLPPLPAFDKRLNYMDEYWNIYLQN